MWKIRPEQREDVGAVEVLDTLGFGAGRYAKTAYRLREGVKPEARLCFVAEENKKLLGTVRFWPIMVGAKLSLLLGPIAVQPKLRGKGIGVALMQKGIEEAKRLGYETIILVGDESYYARAGFARLKPGQVRFPGPLDAERILGLALKPGALEKFEGAVARAHIDVPVSANAAPLG
jgi:predicted N-acetyltransferase YhbS